MFTITKTRTIAAAVTGAAATGAIVVTVAMVSTAQAMPSENKSCTSKAVSVAAGERSGAAGIASIPLTITNTSESSCSIAGAPGVQGVVHGAGSHDIGDPAVPTRAAMEKLTVLKPGASATAILRIANADTTPGAAHPIDGFNVTLPGDNEPVFVEIAEQARKSGPWLGLDELLLK